MAALLNTAPTAGATTQTAHNGQSVVDNRLILNPEIGIHITEQRLLCAYGDS